MTAHARVSPSALHWTLNCPPSLMLGEQFPDSESRYAAEGTAGHALGEHQIRKFLNLPTECPTSEYYTDELTEAVEDYVDYVIHEIEDARLLCADPILQPEMRISLSGYVQDCFGTGDMVIVTNKYIHIIDLKLGKGVAVSALNNPQLKAYGLGVLDTFGDLYDIETVKLTIFQPRINNFSTWETTPAELREWGEDELCPKAAQALAGEGEFACGDWCRFCKARAVCRKRAEHNLELAQYDFEMPSTLDDTEIAAILGKADEVAAWAADVKEYALRQAINGISYDGWKVVEGRSNRKYTYEKAVANAVSEAGFNPYEQKLLGITAMTSMLGKKRFSELIENSGLTEKPQGKPTLVPITDKRQPLSTAITDFD